MQPLEKRKNKRAKRCCTVRIRPFPSQMDAGGSSNWDTVTMKDLSESGMLFSHTKKITIGTMLEFKIGLPSSVEPVECIGQVCRVDEKLINKVSVAQIPVYLIAVYFKNMDTNKKEAIRKVCGVY